MRLNRFLLALALAACSIKAWAADVEYEIGPDQFEHASPIPMAMHFAGASYDHPLYEGLWPMTLAAFCQLHEPQDQVVFTFCIAAIK